MGCGYSIDGSVKVRNNEQTREILARLQDSTGEIDVSEETLDDGSMIVEIGGFTECSYDQATKMDGIIQEFGPHAVEPACLRTECDGEAGDLWVGTPEAVAENQRQALIQDARDAIAKLTPDDREALLAEYLKPKQSKK